MCICINIHILKREYKIYTYKKENTFYRFFFMFVSKKTPGFPLLLVVTICKQHKHIYIYIYIYIYKQQYIYKVTLLFFFYIYRMASGYMSGSKNPVEPAKLLRSALEIRSRKQLGPGTGM